MRLRAEYCSRLGQTVRPLALGGSVFREAACQQVDYAGEPAARFEPRVPFVHASGVMGHQPGVDPSAAPTLAPATTLACSSTTRRRLPFELTIALRMS